MSHVRTPHQATPKIPVPPAPKTPVRSAQIAPVRPTPRIPVRPAPKTPVRPAQIALVRPTPRIPVRPAPIASVRPTLLPQRIIARSPAAPRYIPVLQPPTFRKESDFIYKNEDQQNEKIDDHSTLVDHDHHRKLTTQISMRAPTFIPQQNYPKQPLLRLSTQPVRHAERKYPSDFYFPK